MNSKEILFLYELLMEREERGFLQAILEDPTSLATRNAYHDFLLDKGRPKSAELILDLRFTPTKGTVLDDPVTSWAMSSLSSGSVMIQTPPIGPNTVLSPRLRRSIGQPGMSTSGAMWGDSTIGSVDIGDK